MVFLKKLGHFRFGIGVKDQGPKVKQQKKSNNKWNCVICNQKQSVRKVFAQGFMANDVRKFVQAFNMSRHFSEENKDQTLTLPSQEFDNNSSIHKKRRTDWTEFIDPDDDDDANQEEETGFLLEPKIVTELTKETFKKPKLKNYTAGLNNAQVNKPFMPIPSKRISNHPIIYQEKEEPRKCQPAIAKESSKWSDYFTQDDDDLPLERGRELPDPLWPWSQGVVDTQFKDQRVEDEVHPDFK
ncbi:hypothetical protein HHK36_004137 [Tetracentron sinense]|uniref:MRN complex-interacting protein N-terminal domain-containing protein n=1 Tax=Tetracentron sinense TaxID=13715 RepID=A0A834ZQM2_TETSI|nr:hypothetical protein HHK36_004137 [Tetracentron sinense]